MKTQPKSIFYSLIHKNSYIFLICNYMNNSYTKKHE